MRRLGGSGIWETFIPGLAPGELYKYEIKSPGLPVFQKADPYASYAEEPPNTSSVVYESKYRFRDRSGWNSAQTVEHFRRPLSIYEVHFGSWRRLAEEDNRPLNYREMAEPLAKYVRKMASLMSSFCRLRSFRMGHPGVIRSVITTHPQRAMARLTTCGIWSIICTGKILA